MGSVCFAMPAVACWNGPNRNVSRCSMVQQVATVWITNKMEGGVCAGPDENRVHRVVSWEDGNEGFCNNNPKSSHVSTVMSRACNAWKAPLTRVAVLPGFPIVASDRLNLEREKILSYSSTDIVSRVGMRDNALNTGRVKAEGHNVMFWSLLKPASMRMM